MKYKYSAFVITLLLLVSTFSIYAQVSSSLSQQVNSNASAFSQTKIHLTLEDSIRLKIKNISEKINNSKISNQAKKLNEQQTSLTQIVQNPPQMPSINDLDEKAKQAIMSQNALKKANQLAKNMDRIAFLKNSEKLVESVTLLQESTLKKIWDRTIYSFDLTIGSNQSGNLQKIVPAVGVRISKFYTLGIGFPLQHTSINTNFNQKSFEDFMYGVKLYHRFNLPKGLYMQIDNDFVNSSFSENQVRQWMPAMWTGFGYNLKLTKYFGASAMVMYNPLHKEQYTPYSLPIDIRVGFNWYQVTKPIFR
jgi:hypothetical protein